jgi:hypothetical protein
MGFRLLAYGSLTLASAYHADKADKRSGKQDLPRRTVSWHLLIVRGIDHTGPLRDNPPFGSSDRPQ